LTHLGRGRKKARRYKQNETGDIEKKTNSIKLGIIILSGERKALFFNWGGGGGCGGVGGGGGVFLGGGGVGGGGGGVFVWGVWVFWGGGF